MNDVGATGGGRPSFNLLEQPWIRVTYLKGRVGLVSLRDLWSRPIESVRFQVTCLSRPCLS